MKKVLLVSFAFLFPVFLAAGSDAMMMDGKGMGMMGMEGMGMCKCMEKDMGKGMKMGMDMSDEMHMMGRMMSVGLDDKQTEDLRNIHMKLKKEVIREKAEMEIAEIELREILRKDPVDLKGAEAKIKQIETLQSEVKILHIKAKEEAKDKLTTEQRKKFNSVVQRHQMGEGMGMMKECEKMKSMDQMEHEDAKDSDDSSSPGSMQHQHH